MATAAEIIAALDLRPLPREGGYYRETYRSPKKWADGQRNLSTAIYYLLTPDTYSALHRLPCDEIFHFYAGDSVLMLQLWPDGTGRIVTLSPDLAAGRQPQLLVPAGVWQGSWLSDGGTFALMGTTMAPGFDFSDYEEGDMDELMCEYPAFAQAIARLGGSAKPPFPNR